MLYEKLNLLRSFSMQEHDEYFINRKCFSEFGFPDLKFYALNNVPFSTY